MHLPANYRIYLTKRLADQLCECRARSYPILEAQHRPQGFGDRTDKRLPQSTLETWQAVLDRLNYLCDQWTQAEDSDKPTSEFCSAEPKTALNALVEALKREEKREEAIDAVCYERVNAHQYYDYVSMHHTNKIFLETDHRWRRLKLFRDWRYEFIRDWDLPPAVDAYHALLALQEYALMRGWSTTEGFGESLSDKALKETEDNFTGDIKALRTRMDNIVEVYGRLPVEKGWPK